MSFSLEQKKAIAIAEARKRQFEAQQIAIDQTNLESEELPQSDAQQNLMPQTFEQSDLPRNEAGPWQPPLVEQQQAQPTLAQQAVNVAAEGASAVNRGVTNIADFLTTDQINAALALAGSDKRAPSITDMLAPATQGGFMQPGLAKDVVTTAGELAAPGAAGGALVRGASKLLPAQAAGESALVGTARSLGAGTTAGGDVVAGAASGAGAEIGEEYGGTAGAIAGGMLGPTAVMGAKQALARLSQDIPLFNSSGLPSEDFQAALQTRKLDIADIADDIDKLPPTFKPKDASDLVDTLLEQKLVAGDASPALAEIRLIPKSMKSQGGEFRPGAFLKDKKFIADDLVKKAVKLGYQPGEVASAKGANDPTRAAMTKVLNIHRQIYRDASKALEYNRPINVAGKIVQQRVDLVMNRADQLRKQLDGIANNKLRGKKVDFGAMEKKVIDELGKFRIDIPEDVPRDVTSIKNFLSKKSAFMGSNLKEDSGSQRIIKKTLSILEDAKTGNAKDMHFVKRQIDAYLDDVFGTRPGLKNSGLNFSAKVRRLSNEAVRDIDSEYKDVNKALSTALDMKDNVVKTITKKIDLNDAQLSEAVIGNELRKLLSNYRVGPEINKTLKNIDDVARQFGAEKTLGEDFKIDVQRLAQFSNSLDNRFGPVAAPRSYKGETAAGTKLGLDASASIETMAANAAIQGGKKLIKAAIPKKQTDLEAYDTMQKLLKRGK